MITYTKRIYPELTQQDFDEIIVPLIDNVSILEAHYYEHINTPFNTSSSEDYPYYNVCMTFANQLWEKVWTKSLDQTVKHARTFKMMTIQILSQLVFTYLIRCFSEDIKVQPIQESPEETYKAYSQSLLNDGLKRFSCKYPVAWGRINQLLENKMMALVKVIKNIVKDRQIIADKFGISIASRIETLVSEGDSHNHGSAVTIITFECGSKLVYKPRSVSGEVAYGKLLVRLNPNLCEPMMAAEALECEGYGYTGFLKSSPENSNMYQAGRLACLLYLLNATDMHYSNILWTEKGPIPIDLETLFHPRRIRTGTKESEKSAYMALETSVYGTGVLPLILTSKNSKGSVDVGFTGTRDENSQSPFKMFNIVDGFSSNIKVVWRPQKQDNTLSKDKVLEAEIYERCDKIVSGFSDMYKEVFAVKDIFAEVVTNTFEDVKLRYIHNMTYRYTQLLRCLVDAEPSRDKSVAHSLLTRIGILALSSDPKITLSECKQMWDGDIPYFSVKFSERNLYAGNAVISYLNQSPQNEFLNKMGRLSNKDLKRQEELIKLAFLAKLEDPHAEGKLDFSTLDKREEQIIVNNNTALLEVIEWFKNELIDSKLDDRFTHLPTTWIGPIVRYGNVGWTPGVLGYDLYAGRVGCALSLAAAGKVLNDDEALRIASEVFDRSAKIISSKTYELRNVLMSGVGAFSGVSGLLWALCGASDITGNKSWRQAAMKAWDLLPNLFSEMRGDFYDIIMGQSGAIVMRLITQEDFVISDEEIDFCLNKAEENLCDIGPMTTSGLAHGLGQILWFFGILSRKSDRSDIRGMIHKVIKIISDDFTDHEGFIQIYSGADKQVSSSWCNGLTGLLIAYYEAYKSGHVNRELLVDLINQISVIPLSNVPILCHGSVGIVQALEYVNPDFKEETDAIIYSLNQNYTSTDYLYQYYKTGESRYPLSPGMMAGRSGVLLHLCKKADPSITISPLTLGL